MLGELRCGDRLLDLSRPRIMGILNTTPDSFSDGGQLLRDGGLNLRMALDRARAMVEAGAAILDVGGESTRPGASPVTVQEEMQRVLPLVEAINRELDVIISVDTSSPELMTAAAERGAGLINDVRALRRPGALQAAAESGLPVCLMHMPGEPDSMQKLTNYSRGVTAEVREFLVQRIKAAHAAGIHEQAILLDPGFGFGKTLEHNLALFRALPEFLELGLPVLVGVSRKTMVGAITGREVDQRLAGSVAFALLAAQSGARIVRVHDVEATADAFRVLAAVGDAS